MPEPYPILYKYNDLYNSPSESQSFGTIFFRFIWEKTKKDIILCRQKIILSNGVMAAQQILVLFVQVRILVGQLRKPDFTSGFLFFLQTSLKEHIKTLEMKPGHFYVKDTIPI